MNEDALSETSICRLIGSAITHDGRDRIVPSMDLRRDLGIDSVGLMSIVYVLEEQVGIDAFSHVDEFIRAEEVADLIEIVQQDGGGR